MASDLWGTAFGCRDEMMDGTSQLSACVRPDHVELLAEDVMHDGGGVLVRLNRRQVRGLAHALLAMAEELG